MALNLLVTAAIVLWFCVAWHRAALRRSRSSEAIDAEFLYMRGELTSGDYGKNFVGASISVATVYVGISDFSHHYRGDAWWLLIAFLLGIPVFLFHLERLAPLFRPASTLPQAIHNAFQSPLLRTLVAICCLIYLVGFVGVELYVVGLVLLPVFGSTSLFLSCLSVIFVSMFFVSYSLAGGYRGMKENDTSQLASMVISLVLMLVLFGVVIHKSPQYTLPGPNDLLPLPAPPWRGMRLVIVGSCLALMLPWLAATPDTWHRCLAADLDLKRVRRGFWGPRHINPCALALFYALPIVIGVSLQPATKSAHPFGLFLAQGWGAVSNLPVPLPGVVFGLLLAGLVGASMSSVDVLLMTVAFLVCRDFIPGFDTARSETKLSTARFAVFAGGLVATAIPIAAFVLHLDLYLVMSTLGSCVIVLFPLLLTMALFPNQCSRSRATRVFGVISVGTPLAFAFCAVICALLLLDGQAAASFLASVPLISFLASFLLILPSWMLLARARSLHESPEGPGHDIS